jgi:hypothetical protein
MMMIALPRFAFAEKGMARSAQEKAAKKACSVGDFQKGVDILGDLFVDTNDTTYVYNQGRCYQQNSRWEQAINRFREYLRKAKDLSDADRAEVNQQITECETSLGKAAQVAPPPATAAPPPIARVEMPPTAPAPIAPEVATAPPVPAPSDNSQGKGLRTAGIVCAVVGLAAVGTGVGLAIKTQSITSDEKKVGGATPAQEDQRKSLVTWGWVSYGIGAAALATGVVLYIAGWPGSDHSTNVSLLPILAPDGASLMLKGRF